ncbi:hypothetical protein FK531_00380 [Rhodococcus spelaei]|uniref:Uncharacterized protein n=1 Tax=Rhodococcus spelaei TaxID=2546320 RepID=A0A541BQM8_9NOCA|nr:hypothetical protein [Rhodococcus spelaei]TQF74605.1 hypothetical protein FK531_00380 [Rhodococcus spelaei]
MDQDDPLLTTLGLTDALPPLPDDVWERALTIALDPTTPAVDADLVPEMDDTPVVPDDDEIVLDDDTDGLLLDDDTDGPELDAGDASDGSVRHDSDSDDHDLPVDHGGSIQHDSDHDELPGYHGGIDHHDSDAVDLGDFGGDVY